MGSTYCANPERCLGCRACEMICSLTNAGLCSTEKSHIKVNFDLFTAKVDVQVTDCVGCKQCIGFCPEAVLRYKEG
jgi:Fe-S-cluster-containing hydrogenase component 2